MYKKIWLISLFLGVLQAAHVCSTDFSDEANIYRFLGGTIAGTLIIGVPVSMIIWLYRKLSVVRTQKT